MRLLFVSTGNVCRSPIAERLLRSWAERELGDEARSIQMESAGTEEASGPMEDRSAPDGAVADSCASAGRGRPAGTDHDPASAAIGPRARSADHVASVPPRRGVVTVAARRRHRPGRAAVGRARAGTDCPAERGASASRRRHQPTTSATRWAASRSTSGGCRTDRRSPPPACRRAAHPGERLAGGRPTGFMISRPGTLTLPLRRHPDSGGRPVGSAVAAGPRTWPRQLPDAPRRAERSGR